MQETETPDGLFRMVLVVSPQVSLDEDADLPGFVLERLRASSPMADGAAAIWENAEAIRVERREPTLSKAGKFQPLLRHRSD